MELAGIRNLNRSRSRFGYDSLLRTLLFTIQPTDPIVFGSVAAVLAAAAILGAISPPNAPRERIPPWCSGRSSCAAPHAGFEIN
jgi:hypothetical protein